jgi:hypothetical protein
LRLFGRTSPPSNEHGSMAGERVKAERLRGVEITDEKPCDSF